MSVLYSLQGTGSLQLGGLPAPTFPGQCSRFEIKAISPSLAYKEKTALFLEVTWLL